MNDKKPPANLGVSIGLVCWGLCFLNFPKFVGMALVLAWICYILGFLILLVGVMGACIELDRMRK